VLLAHCVHLRCRRCWRFRHKHCSWAIATVLARFPVAQGSCASVARALTAPADRAAPSPRLLPRHRHSVTPASRVFFGQSRWYDSRSAARTGSRRRPPRYYRQSLRQHACGGSARVRPGAGSQPVKPAPLPRRLPRRTKRKRNMHSAEQSTCLSAMTRIRDLRRVVPARGTIWAH